jgi:hypothetical protein
MMVGAVSPPASGAAAQGAGQSAQLASAAPPTGPAPLQLPGVLASGDAALAVLERMLTLQAQQQTRSLVQQYRAAAGPPPTFSGKQARGIEVHTWLGAMERYFEAAHMVGEEYDAERVVVAAAALRDMAQLWWTALRAPGGVGAPTTWAAFRAAVAKQYQPQAPERWAMQQLDALTGGNNADVALYTTRVLELFQLLPNMDELSRVMTYERGLPETFRAKCAEKQHATLQAATEAMLALWNAKLAAGAPARSGRVAAAALSHTEDDGAAASEPGNRSEGQFVAAAAAGPAQYGSQQDLAAAVVAAMTAWEERKAKVGADGVGGRPNRRSKTRDFRREGERRPRSSSAPRLPDDVYEARREAGLCYKCGQEGHRAARCKNKRNEEMPTETSSGE